MPLIIGIFIFFLLLIGLLIEKFLVKKNWSNPFINGFYIFNMIFSSPFNVIVALFILANLLDNGILNINGYIHGSSNIISISSITILLFIVLTSLIGLTVYFLWTYFNYYRKIKINYQSLVYFSKIFIFRIPLLIITLGLSYPDSGTEWSRTFILSFIMLSGLYVVPLFMLIFKYLINKKINFGRK